MKPTLAVLALLLAAASRAETHYFVTLLKGERIGWSSAETHTETLDGKPASRFTNHSTTVVNLGGKHFTVLADNVYWSTPDNHLLRTSTLLVTGGKRFRTEAVYGEKAVEFDGDWDGQKVHRTVPLPEGPVFADRERAIHDALPADGTLAMWGLDEQGTKFERSELKGLGPATVDLGGKPTAAVLTEARVGGNAIKVYTSLSGELLREEMPLGMVSVAATKAVALAPLPKAAGDQDVLELTALRADRPLKDLRVGQVLRLRFTGLDLSKIPNDPDQIVRQDGDAWIVQTGPGALQISDPKAWTGRIKGQDAWLSPSPLISSDDSKLRAVALKLAPADTAFYGAIHSVRTYVGERMRYEIGFGAGQDAREILRHPKGKCTDYAVLTVALLRAAGIPARLVSGLYTDDGVFYRHAWAEAWDGSHWFGVDSTADSDSLTPGYIKLSRGNVADTFDRDTVIDPAIAKIEVLTETGTSPSATPAKSP